MNKFHGQVYIIHLYTLMPQAEFSEDFHCLVHRLASNNTDGCTSSFFIMLSELQEVQCSTNYGTTVILKGLPKKTICWEMSTANGLNCGKP